MAPLLIEFDTFPAEKALIGEMLMAYGEIEFELARLLSVALGDDNVAGRVLFRIRGEGARIEVADAILRHSLTKIGLDGQWGNTLGALRHCKNIRNQYAHCHWWNDPAKPGLCFMDMDVDAAQKGGGLEITFQPVDLTLLKAQHVFFEHALDWLYFLDEQYRKLEGLSSSHQRVAPKSIPQPPLSNRKALLAQSSAASDTNP